MNKRVVESLFFVLIVLLILLFLSVKEFVKINPTGFAVYTSCSDSQRIMRLYSSTNAHGEIYNGAGNYQTDICYDGIFGSSYNGANPHDCTVSNKVLGLYSTTNAHAEIPSRTTYTTNVCYGDLVCANRATCNADEQVVVSLFAETNAHISKGDDSTYPIKICCKRGGTCTPNCAGKVCGGDGCGESCPPGCQTGYSCNSTGQCVSGTCTPNWQAKLGSCGSNERQTVTYNDTNNCNDNAGKPADTTTCCDNNHNGVAGNLTSFNSLGMTLDLYINDNIPSETDVFSPGVKKRIKFVDEDSVERVWFEYSFNSPLNMCGISIEKQPEFDKRGYLTVKGLSNMEKRLSVDRLNSSSSYVCVKDAEVSDISEVSDNCDETNEREVKCDNSDTKHPCEIIEDTFIVQKVKNSAVIEMLPGAIVTCVPTWGNCTSWGSCVNGIKKRTCTDTRTPKCNSSVKIETQTCGCVENWNCDWEPEECPSTEIQTAVNCLDEATCGTTGSKPTTRTCTFEQQITTECTSDIDCLEGQVCDNGECVEKPKSNIGLIIIISILIIAIIAVAIAIIYFWKKPKPKAPTSSMMQRRPPFFPPPGPSQIRRPGPPFLPPPSRL